jgi:glutathione S-transferase
MQKMKFYLNSLSPNTKRLVVCANELGLSPEMIELDFAKGEHKSSDYLRLNPNGKVPAMIDDDGFEMWESAAMAWYLAERNPSKGLLPADLKGRADQMRWMFWNACHVEPAALSIAMERFIKPTMMKQDGDETKVASAMTDLSRYLPVLNGRLEGREWLGDTCSLADLSLGVTIESCALLNVDLTPYPHLMAWLGRLQARPSWKKASAK